MRIKDGYVLREVADQIIVVPTGTVAINFNGVITLNKSAKLLWEELVKGSTHEGLVEILLNTYDVSKEQATEDVKEFLAILQKNNILDE